MAARKPTIQRSDATNVVGAGAAGGGIGTVIAAVANGLPDTSEWKSALTVSSPLIAVGISGLWLFVKAVYIDPFVNNRKHRVTDEAMEKILSDARATAARTVDDPNASEEHKKEVKKMVEELEKLQIKKITERMEVVAQD
jgi:hypothetical protein